MKNNFEKIYKNLSVDEKKVIETLASKVCKELDEYRIMGMDVEIEDIAIVSLGICSQFAGSKTQVEFLTKLVITDIMDKVLNKAA